MTKMPGFSAESSLCKFDGHFYLTKTPLQSDVGVHPAQFGEDVNRPWNLPGPFAVSGFCPRGLQPVLARRCAASVPELYCVFTEGGLPWCRDTGKRMCIAYKTAWECQLATIRP